MAAMRRAAEQQDDNLKALNEQIAALKGEVVKLQAEREKQLEVAAEHARSTAKGRPYEEAVFEAVDAIARRARRRLRRGRRPARRRRAQGRRVVGVDGCAGPRARPDRLRGQERLRAEEQGASPSSTRRWSSATPTTASGSCPPTSCCPAAAPQLREVNGDKLFVVFDPEEGRARARGRLRAGPRAHADGRQAERRGARRRRRCAPRSSARWPRWTTCAGSSRSSRSATSGHRRRARKILDDDGRARPPAPGPAVDELVVAGTGDDRPPQGTLVVAARRVPLPRARASRRRSLTAAPVRRIAPQ